MLFYPTNREVANNSMTNWPRGSKAYPQGSVWWRKAVYLTADAGHRERGRGQHPTNPTKSTTSQDLKPLLGLTT